MKNSPYILIVFLAVFLSTACQKRTEEVNIEDGSIELNKAQFEMSDMELGVPVAHVFRESIAINGLVKVAPKGKTQVSTLIPGRVKRIGFSSGQYVEKGSVLFELEGFEMIQLQQEYAQCNADFHFATSNRLRMESLSDDNITAKRELQLANKEYLSLKALHEALTLKLKLVGIDPALVAAGSFASTIKIKSTISGYLSKQRIQSGQYLEPQQKAMEIISMDGLCLQLNVFSKEIGRLERNQKVLFFDPDRRNEIYEANLHVVGKSIDNTSKTVPCIALIKEADKANFVDGMYVECEIITCERESMAIPTEAIIKDGYNYYVLVKTGGEGEEMSFSKVEVEVGREEIEFTEILTTGLKDVLLKGVYNLSGE